MRARRRRQTRVKLSGADLESRAPWNFAAGPGPSCGVLHGNPAELTHRGAARSGCQVTERRVAGDGVPRGCRRGAVSREHTPAAGGMPDLTGWPEIVADHPRFTPGSRFESCRPPDRVASDAARCRGGHVRTLLGPHELDGMMFVYPSPHANTGIVNIAVRESDLYESYHWLIFWRETHVCSFSRSRARRGWSRCGRLRRRQRCRGSCGRVAEHRQRRVHLHQHGHRRQRRPVRRLDLDPAGHHRRQGRRPTTRSSNGAQPSIVDHGQPEVARSMVDAQITALRGAVPGRPPDRSSRAAARRGAGPCRRGRRVGRRARR